MSEDEFDFSSLAKKTPPQEPPKPPTPTLRQCASCEQSFPAGDCTKYRNKWYCADCLIEKKAEYQQKNIPPPPEVIELRINFKKVLDKIDQLYREFQADGSHPEWRQIFKRLYYNYQYKQWQPVGHSYRQHDAILWATFFNTYWKEITS